MSIENRQVKDFKLEEACVLRWSGITKTVQIAEDKSGFLKTSIARKSVSIPTKGKKKASTKIILDNISGSASPGEVLALMGPSGSGKTSLLDALSGRSVYQQGTLTVNGIEVEKSMMKKFKRKVAYIKQADYFFDHLTVRDQLTYTALLRLPSMQKKSEKHREVNRIMALLRLQKCADTPIRLLSGGEKKRVNIGTELLTDPQVILLDEPTSGLDSTSAVALMNMLQDFAKQNGTTIITSIHQPSSAVFRSFDKLIMLAEGHVVYYGTPLQSMAYLQDKELACPSGYNAADHWMDVLVVDSSSIIGIDGDENEEKKDPDEEFGNMLGHSKTRQYLIESWDEETHTESTRNEMKNDLKIFTHPIFLKNSSTKFNTSWVTQFLILNHRAMRNARSAVITKVNLLKSVVVGLIMGFIWYQLPYSESTVTDRDGYFFFTITFQLFETMFGALFSYPKEALIISKERASGSYHLSAYFIAKSCSELPTTMILPTIYLVLSYSLAGINNNFWVFLGTLICILLAAISGESVGLLVGAVFSDSEEAMAVLVVLAVLLMVIGGFFVQNIPNFMLWFKYLSPFKYAFDACRQIVFNKPVPCDGSGVLMICDGNTEFASPSDIMESLGVQGGISFNIGMLIVLFVVPRYLAYYSIRRKKPEERT